jgi:hypothetical protein
MGYGRIGWNTWLRLRDYKIGGVEYPLAEERLGMSITPFGRAYYERSFVRYHELYPAIDAPTPEIEVDPLEPFVEVIQDHSTCQACRSAYPVAVTRTYRQNQKWIWSVELSSQRIEGRVTGKYHEIEQCLCQEGEIQEVFAPFLALLDRFIAKKWQMCFLYYRRWFYDLDYLVGGMANGREQRWYASALVKTKVLPLLSDTDIDDDHNVAKGEMRFCVNERRGVGSIYSLTAPDDLRPQPLAMARRVTL